MKALHIADISELLREVKKYEQFERLKHEYISRKTKSFYERPLLPRRTHEELLEHWWRSGFIEPPRQMQNPERYERIWAKHLAGKMFREIAEEEGISKGRAHQIFWRWERQRFSQMKYAAYRWDRETIRRPLVFAEDESHRDRWIDYDL